MIVYSLDWSTHVVNECKRTEIILHALHEDGKTSRRIQGFSFRFFVAINSMNDIGDLQGILFKSMNVSVNLEPARDLGSVEMVRFLGKTQLFAVVSSECHVCLKKAFYVLRKSRWKNYTYIRTYEGETAPVTQFLTYLGIKPHSWIGVPMDNVIHYSCIFPTESTEIPSNLCIGAYDIECLSEDCVSFPDPKIDTMQQNGLVLSYPIQAKPDQQFMISLKT